MASSSSSNKPTPAFSSSSSPSLLDGVKDVIPDAKPLLLLQDLCGNLGQSHLLDGFRKDPTHPDNIQKVQNLAQQLWKLNGAYPGGLKGYIEKAKKLLQDSKDGVNPLDGWSPAVPEGEKFDLGTDLYDATEAEGRKLLGKVGFVLVAGGLGERLGYNGAKARDMDCWGGRYLYRYLCHVIVWSSNIHSLTLLFVILLQRYRLDFPPNRRQEPCTFNTTPSTSKRLNESTLRTIPKRILDSSYHFVSWFPTIPNNPHCNC